MAIEPARTVLTDRHWLREIASFLDGLPGLLSAFHKQTRPGTVARGLLVNDAIDAQDLRVLDTLSRLAREPQYARDFSFDEAVETAARMARLRSLQWLLERQPLAAPTCSPQLLDAIVAGAGDVSVVHWLLENYPLSVQSATTETLNKAAANGHFDIVQWIHEKGSFDSAFAPSVMDSAAASGHLDIVSFLQANRHEGCSVAAPIAAARYSHLAILRFLFDHYPEHFSSPEILDFAGAGSEIDRLESVRFLHDVCNAPCTRSAIDNAVAGGNAAVVEYLLDHRSEGFSSNAITTASRAGYTDLVTRLLERWSDTLGGTSGDELNLVPAITAASQQGHLEIVRRLLSAGNQSWNVSGALRAPSARGDIEMVGVLIEKGRWRSLVDATCQALYYGHDEIVALLKKAHYERQQQQSIVKEV